MELFKLLGTIAIDNVKANGELDSTMEKAKMSEEELSGSFEKIGNAAGKIAIGIGTAAVAIGTAWVAAIESTKEYRVQMGMLETAYTNAGFSAESAKKTHSELNAVLGDSGQATEASQQLAKLTQNEKDLDQWTHILTGVYATFGESLPIEGLAEAANETAKVGTVTGSLADALNWAGISEDEFNKKLEKCNTEAEREKLIRETLNGVYDSAADKYKTVNADVMEAEKAQARLSDAIAQVGAIGEPILTAIKNKIAEMAELAIPKIQGMVDKFQSMMTWVRNNEQTLKNWGTVIAGLIVSVGAFVLIISWGKIMTAAANAIKVVRAAMILFNATLKANPIGLIISLIAGLVTAFVLLWKNNEGFRNFWISLWKKIKSTAGSAVDWIKDKFNVLKQVVTNVKTIFNNVKNAITDRLETAKNKVKSIIDKIKGFFNTTLKFKGLKLPSIKLTMEKGSGLMAKAAELLGLSGVPKFSVNWNALGAIFDQPTIFATPQGFQGVGEAGAEAVTPISVLQKYVDESVGRRNQDIISAFEIQVSRLISFMQAFFPKEYKIMFETGVLAGELAPAMDVQLGNIMSGRERGR